MKSFRLASGAKVGNTGRTLVDDRVREFHMQLRHFVGGDENLTSTT